MNTGPTSTTTMTKIFESLEFVSRLDGIEAFTTLRGDAVAGDNYSSFNICNYTGDSLNHIAACRRLLCQELGIADSDLILPRQTHSSLVATITAESRHEANLEGIDALVTDLPNVAIGVNTADCVPIVLADSEAGVLGVAHAGWKGSKDRIACRTVEAMCQLGANPQRIMAAVGAAICQDCFEVGDEVLQQFIEAGFDPAIIAKRNPATGKAHIDLPLVNRLNLVQSGVPDANIALSHRCTRCQPLRYFSARRIGIHSGRIFTGIIRRK